MAKFNPTTPTSACCPTSQSSGLALIDWWIQRGSQTPTNSKFGLVNASDSTEENLLTYHIEKYYPAHSLARSSAINIELSANWAMERRQHSARSGPPEIVFKMGLECDEQGPPCVNCVVRNLKCVYWLPPPQGSTPRHTKSQSTKNSQEAPHSTSSSETECSNGFTTTLSPSPLAFSSTPDSQRLLELELMHRWSTRTWMGLFSIPEDQEYLQNYLPRAALRSSYLMNGLLAISALDLAQNTSNKSESTTYFYAALEYSNKASVGFRAELSDIRHDNLHVLYHFAMIAAVFSFVSLPEESSALDRMNTVFDMIMGGCDIAYTNAAWLFDSPCSFSAFFKYGMATLDIVDPVTWTALGNLSSVSRQVRVSGVYHKRGSAAQEESECGDPLASDVDSYRFAIGQTKYSFVEDARGLVKFYCLSVATMGGREFLAAMKRLEPMALFIMMYVGVLLDRMACDIRGWWVESVGRDLVQEISDILQYSPIARIPEGLEGISWTRQQVGLPPLLNISLVEPIMLQPSPPVIGQVQTPSISNDRGSLVSMELS
ncbi:hypothetical protein FQN57_007234 [Myotisia sp. PD_48]|nr:hypothetical protein FQN57_007234 [Myotisia sp. PD_48]